VSYTNYNMNLFFDNINNDGNLVKKEQIQEELRTMELIKYCTTYENTVDNDKLLGITMDEIDSLYDLVYNTEISEMPCNHVIRKMLYVEQSKENLLNLKSSSTTDDLDFY